MTFAARCSLQMLSALLALCTLGLQALDAPVSLDPIRLPDAPGFKPVLLTELPDFNAEVESKVSKSGKVHVNGLLQTINYMEFKERKPAIKEEMFELLPDQTRFLKPVHVRLFRQEGKAPLAVTLLGFGQKADDKLARAWQAYLYDSGCHVLSFDSLVRNNMNEATGHGVAGNFVAESAIVCRIVDAVLASEGKSGTPFRSQVSSVRLLGTSYGGLLAMQCLREAGAKEWPIDRCVIVSTPVNMKTAAQRLDTFAREDAPFFGLFSLAKLMGGYTPKGDTPTPREEALMRAGIGYVFHGDLQQYAKSNIERYDPELPLRLKNQEEQPQQKELYEDMLAGMKERHRAELKELESQRGMLDKEDYEARKKDLEARQKVQELIARRLPSHVNEWNFYDYVFLLLRPYWKLKRADSSGVTLDTMLKGAPNFVQVYIAADDPLNDPREFAEMSQRIPAPLLQVLPHGGHLGFTGTKWTEEMIKRTFKP